MSKLIDAGNTWSNFFCFFSSWTISFLWDSYCTNISSSYRILSCNRQQVINSLDTYFFLNFLFRTSQFLILTLQFFHSLSQPLQFFVHFLLAGLQLLQLSLVIIWFTLCFWKLRRKMSVSSAELQNGYLLSKLLQFVLKCCLCLLFVFHLLLKMIHFFL